LPRGYRRKKRFISSRVYGIVYKRRIFYKSERLTGAVEAGGDGVEKSVLRREKSFSTRHPAGFRRRRRADEYEDLTCQRLERCVALAGDLTQKTAALDTGPGTRDDGETTGVMMHQSTCCCCCHHSNSSNRHHGDKLCIATAQERATAIILRERDPRATDI